MKLTSEQRRRIANKLRMKLEKAKSMTVTRDEIGDMSVNLPSSTTWKAYKRKSRCPETASPRQMRKPYGSAMTGEWDNGKRNSGLSK